MRTITDNFNNTAIAASSSPVAYALGSPSWILGTVIIWLWLAASDDAEQEQKEIAKRHKRAVQQQVIAAPLPRPAPAPGF